MTQTEGPCGLADIAQVADRARSTVHYHLKALGERDYVVCEDDRYRLSCRFLKMGFAVRDQFEIYPMIESHLEQIAEASGERVWCTAMEKDAACSSPALVANTRFPPTRRSASECHFTSSVAGNRCWLISTGTGSKLSSIGTDCRRERNIR